MENLATLTSSDNERYDCTLWSRWTFSLVAVELVVVVVAGGDGGNRRHC